MNKLVTCYRERAAELRTLAEKVTDPAMRDELMALAAQWERLAERHRESERPD